MLIGPHLPYEKRRFIHSLIIPGIFVLLMWLIHLTQLEFETTWSFLGVLPRRLEGLPGILFSPMIHADLSHILSNTLSFSILSITLFYFYRSLAFRVFIYVYLLSGLWLWIGGRPAWHIGASGVIYGLAMFLFVSGIIRKHPPLMGISFFVVFLYGGLIWHLFPHTYNDPISWEGHLFGAFAGLLLAFAYQNRGPQRKTFEWEHEEESEAEEESEKDISNPFPN